MLRQAELVMAEKGEENDDIENDGEESLRDTDSPDNLALQRSKSEAVWGHAGVFHVVCKIAVVSV